ncbi:hypothetical protein HY624_02535 [Candidatus Uhrbacteria bacterium]|nr:hypothetical protein [Candidatus Uhrbacteria bacterium]
MFWHFWILKRHPILKNVLNVCVWAFVAFGLYLLLIADERFQPYPKFQAGIAFLSALAMFAPYIVFRVTSLHERFDIALLVYFEFLVIMPLVMNGIGARWLYDLDINYDAIVHFFNSFFLALLTASTMWLMRPQIVNNYPIVIFLTVTLAILVFGILFEFFEAWSDAYWHTSMWGEGHTNIIADTREDVLANTLGGIVAAAVFLWRGTTWLRFLSEQGQRHEA